MKRKIELIDLPRDLPVHYGTCDRRPIRNETSSARGLPGARFLFRWRSKRTLVEVSASPFTDGNAAADSALHERLVEVVRVNGFGRADFVEPPAQLRGDGEVERAEIVRELRRLRGSENDGSDPWLSREP